MKLNYRLGDRKVSSDKDFYRNLLFAIGGNLIFALSINMLIVPLKFYSGGLLGMAQLIRSFLRDSLGINLQNIDMAGIIYYIINIPLFILAYRKLGKVFFYRTIVMSTIFTLMISAIPIPKTPLINDPLTAAIIGGALCGYGSGVLLRSGYSAGGPDILGLYLIKYGKNFSVGKINLIMNIIVFSICALLYNFETVVYSFILNFVISITIDKVHTQNILVQVTIITKLDGIPELIIKHINRGVTSWKGAGGYTGAPMNIYVTMISKYEIDKLFSLVKALDSNAFIITTEGTRVSGKFEKRI